MDYINSILEDVDKLDVALNGRDENEPTIFCGDSNLRRYYIYRTRSGTRSSKQAPRRNDGTYIGFQYWGRY